jgi:integrase
VYKHPIVNKQTGRTYPYWFASITMPDGKRKTASAATKSEAIAKRAELVKGRDEPAPSSRSRMSLGAFLLSWIEVKPPKLAPSTWKQHTSIVRLHLVPALGSILLTALTVSDVNDFLRTPGFSGLTRRHHRPTLRRALSDAIRKDIITRNVAGLAEEPELTSRPGPVLDAAQVRLLLEATDGDRYGSLWALAAHCGLRVSEALALQWEHVDFATRQVHVIATLHRDGNGGWALRTTKTKMNRSVPMSPVVMDSLRKHRLRQAAERLGAPMVFTTASGHHPHKENMVGYLHRATERLGLPRTTVHGLRHSAATILIVSGYPIALVAAFMGHSTSRVTEMTYAHIIGTDLMDAAEVMERAYARG